MIDHKCNGCRYKGEHQEMGFVPFGVCLLEHNLIQAEKNYNAEKCPFMTNGEDIKEAIQSVAEEIYKDNQKEKVELSKDDLAIQEAVQAIQELQKKHNGGALPCIRRYYADFKEILRYGASDIFE